MTFDLDKNIYKPYQNHNNSPIHINKDSNHPHNVLKQLLKSITKRLSETMSSEEIFKISIKIYSKVLKERGFMDELKYLQNEVQQLENSEGRKRKRKVIWFNPLYSTNIKTNMGKVFLKTTFKVRHSNHLRDFKHRKYCNCTELARYVWELKEKNIAQIIRWEILSKVYCNPKQNMYFMFN